MLVSWFAKLGLDPDTVHLQLLAPVHLEPSVHDVLLLQKTCSCEYCSHLLLAEEVAAGSISPHIEVVLNTLARFEAKLRHVVSTVVPMCYGSATLVTAQTKAEPPTPRLLA